MSRGPGTRQRALLHALAALPRDGVLQVVPSDASASEGVSLRRAAKRLVLTGRARAIYLRTEAADGRWAGRLHLTPSDSDRQGDFLPLNPPRWVIPPPPTLFSFPLHLQGQILGQATGTHPVSAPVMCRLARAARQGFRTRRTKVARHEVAPRPAPR